MHGPLASWRRSVANARLVLAFVPYSCELAKLRISQLKLFVARFLCFITQIQRVISVKGCMQG
jgi:hypothetical protein